MKGLNLLFAFLGGAAVGAAAGILFAPGIQLKKEDMEHLVDQIAEEVKGGK